MRGHDATYCYNNYSFLCFLQKGRWQYLLLVISLTRLIFIPLVLMCNVRPRAVPVFFNSDVAPVLLTTALGLSNGFTASVAMVSVG